MALPEGWQRTPIRQVAKLINGDRGKNYPSRSSMVAAGIPFINAGCLRDGRIDLASVNFITEEGYERLGSGKILKGDILFCIRGSLGKSAFVECLDKGAIASSLVIVRPEGAAGKYLHFLLSSPISDQMIRTLDSGSAQPNIGARSLGEYIVPLPPLGEQRKIAAILSSVDEAIEKTQAVIEQVQVVKRGLMQELLTKGLPGRHKRFKQTEIGEIPADWDLVELDELVEDDRPICYGILKPGRGHPGGVPVIKVKNIKGGVIEDHELLLTSPEIDESYRRSRLRSGDVLLSIRGTTGRVAVVPEHLENANITQDTARISISSTSARDFVFVALQGRSLQKQISSWTIGQAVKGINIGRVRKLEVALPREKNEQEEIVAIVAQTDESIRASGQSLKQLQTLKKALMSVLLTGELRVTPDSKPGDPRDPS